MALQNSSVTGFVRDFNEETICLKVYTNYEEPDDTGIDVIEKSAFFE